MNNEYANLIVQYLILYGCYVRPDASLIIARLIITFIPNNLVDTIFITYAANTRLKNNLKENWY
jgi:hypothetical protein